MGKARVGENAWLCVFFGPMLAQTLIRTLSDIWEQLFVPMEPLITSFLYLRAEFLDLEGGWTRSPLAA